jgi:hypothetical protein
MRTPSRAYSAATSMALAGVASPAAVHPGLISPRKSGSRSESVEIVEEGHSDWPRASVDELARRASLSRPEH